MPDLRNQMLRIASELPKGDPTRRKLLATLQQDKQAGDSGWEMMKEVLGDDYMSLVLVRRNMHGATEESTQVADVLAGSLSALAKKLKLDRNTVTAINKMRNLAKNGDRWNHDMRRNQIFKIADLLGVKLPHGMF